MNIELLNALKTAMSNEFENSAAARKELSDNPPSAISFSLEKGLAAMYPNAERAQEAYDEAISKGAVTDVMLHNSGLVVTGHFPIHPDLAGCETEMYTALCTVSAKHLGIEFITEIEDLLSCANKVLLAS